MTIALSAASCTARVHGKSLHKANTVNAGIKSLIGAALLTLSLVHSNAQCEEGLHLRTTYWLCCGES